MARWNSIPYADSFTGRSANAALARSSRATPGSAVTTTRVSPRDSAMRRRLAGEPPAAAASFRCASPAMSDMLPSTGNPRGPGMAAAMPRPPLLFHQYLPHAGPPGDSQCRSDVTAKATTATATKPTTRQGSPPHLAARETYSSQPPQSCVDGDESMSMIRHVYLYVRVQRGYGKMG
ncbi:Os08g0547350 [Oryza sativa Japonica Group]|uniref:Os08g0547350 protein n=1 Tax=Oryza sativa subsp. japonica TaxID=39947 RepID=A0A0P0XIY8_ORYSJ|nr:hypothetical protein EE612_045755 [Oryza sativa]BAT06553.1 Os08g0547350 [Oryza sativa Japonica Group]